MFDKHTYTARREQLKKTVGNGLLLFLGNGESPMNFKDNTYHFRQDSTFLYYFGINAPHLAVIMDIEGDEAIVFGDEHSMDDIIWMGQLETLKEKAEKSGVNQTQPSSALVSYIQKAQQKGRQIHFLPPYRPENQIKLTTMLNIDIDQLAQAASEQFIRAVVAQRSIKSEAEVAEIEKAVNTSVDMHLTAMHLAKPGLTEGALASFVEYIAKNAGGQLAYPPIMTINGHILHNHDHSNTLQDGQLLLNDSGAETAMGYAGDLTRTFPVGKQFTSLQKEAYNIVLRALDTASAALRPGVRYLDIHLHSCKTLAEGLKSLGLMKGDAEEAVAAGAHTLFFQCGTGHMMGLDVHDMEDLGEQYVGYTDALKKDTTTFGLKSLRLGKALEAGHVLTVEPGLYFIPELMDRWKAENKLAQFINYDQLEKFRNFGGIRIEDNLLITDTGRRLLGKPLAKTTSEIEEIRTAAME